MVSDRETISVIMPVWNSEKYLPEAIESVIFQTYKNWELWLVDDGSTDNSALIGQKYSDIDTRIHLVTKKNGGVSSARNAGLEHAQGDYVLFVDADDVIDQDMFEFLVSIMRENDADLSVCGYYINNTPQTRRAESAMKMSRVEAAKRIAGWRQSLMKGYVVNKLFRRELIEKHKLRFDEKTFICEDLLFCEQYVWNCKSIFYDPVPKYHYITRAESAMHGAVSEKRMSVFETYPKIIKVCRQYGNEELDRFIEITYWNHGVSILKDVVKNPSKDQKKYGDIAFSYIRGKVWKFVRCRDISFKRKILIVLLRLYYPVSRCGGLLKKR